MCIGLTNPFSGAMTNSELGERILAIGFQSWIIRQTGQATDQLRIGSVLYRMFAGLSSLFAILFCTLQAVLQMDFLHLDVAANYGLRNQEVSLLASLRKEGKDRLLDLTSHLCANKPWCVPNYTITQHSANRGCSGYLTSTCRWVLERAYSCIQHASVLICKEAHLQ